MRGLLLGVALLGLVPASIAAADEAGDPPWVVAVDGVPIDVIAAEIDPVEVVYVLGKDQLVDGHPFLDGNVLLVRLLSGRARFRLAGDLGQAPVLAQWLSDVAAGQDEITIGRSNPSLRDLPHVYRDCLITRIQVPRLSAGSAEPLKEVIVIKAERPGDPA